MKNEYGPKTDAADSLHAMKYRGPGESFRDAINRVAWRLADDGDHYHDLRDVLLNQRFLPGGRVQGAIGASKRVTPYNCYVSSTIADSFVDGPNSIMDVAKEAAATMRMGGGIGYDFSGLRPRGDAIVKLSSVSSGPVNFMRIYNEVCLCTASSGHRRGAQMGVLRIDHPDVEEFINAKQEEGVLTGFNISLAVTDEFMEALMRKTTFALRFGGKTYREVDAEELWEKVMRSTYDWADPGVLFIDRINRMNNLWYCETIAATNPCGEQPLPPNGACLLGSFNLTKYLRPKPPMDDGVAWDFDFTAFIDDIPIVVRAMDNVVDAAVYPLPAQEAEAKLKRRMGLGITGLANAAEACGFPYGSPGFVKFEEAVLSKLSDHAYMASAMIAKAKGSFPKFDTEKYLTGEFIRTLPDDVRDLIAEHGIRNSHLTSIAPTGTISMCADNVSSGLEPVFSYQTTRPINSPDGPIVTTIDDYGARFLKVRGKLAANVTVGEHVAVLTAAQRFIDSAVSKTCNVPTNISWEDFKGVYLGAHAGGAKGCTTFRDGGKKGGLLTAEPEGASCEIVNGARSCE